MLFQNLNEQAKENAREVFAEMKNDIINEIDWRYAVFQRVHAIAHFAGITIEQDREDFNNGIYVFKGTFDPELAYLNRSCIDSFIWGLDILEYDPEYTFLQALKFFLNNGPDTWNPEIEADIYAVASELYCDDAIRAILEDFCDMVVTMLKRGEEWEYSDDAIEQEEFDWTENGELAEFDDDVYLPDPPAEIIIPA